MAEIDTENQAERLHINSNRHKHESIENVRDV